MDVIPQWKDVLGRAKCNWENKIKMDHDEVFVRTRTGFGWLRIGFQ
jgi:hypothetical protein